VERENAVRLVNEALSREYNSISSYVLHSSPWTTPEDAPALKAFEEIHAQQVETSRWLTTRLREEFGAGPNVRAFEHWKLDLNYLSVPYLVRFSAEHFDTVLREYEARLVECAGEPALMAIFARLRDEAKAHRARLDPYIPKWTEGPRETAPVGEIPQPKERK
jgi:hypothetical protein